MHQSTSRTILVFLTGVLIVSGFVYQLWDALPHRNRLISRLSATSVPVMDFTAVASDTTLRSAGGPSASSELQTLVNLLDPPITAAGGLRHEVASWLSAVNMPVSRVHAWVFIGGDGQRLNPADMHLLRGEPGRSPQERPLYRVRSPQKDAYTYRVVRGGLCGTPYETMAREQPVLLLISAHLDQPGAARYLNLPLYDQQAVRSALADHLTRHLRCRHLEVVTQVTMHWDPPR